MDHQPTIPPATVPWLLPITAIVLTVATFLFDTITNLEIAAPVFYTTVVLMSVQFCRKRGVILAGFGCIALTLLSDMLTRAGPSQAGFINTTISLLAIAITTYLGLKIKSAEIAMHEARAQLAHVARVTTLGELTASIAHEVNQPLTAVVINGNACLRWLADQPPNLGEARRALDRIIKDANRASDVVARVRSLMKKAPPKEDWLDINDVIRATIKLAENEILRSGVVLQAQLSDAVSPIQGDHVQLQQVILNLIVNAIEAMNSVSGGPRLLTITSSMDGSQAVRISVQEFRSGIRAG